MLARLAWSLATATLVAAALDVAVTVQYRTLWSEDAVAVHGFPFVTGAVIGSALLGALVVSRYPRHAIGWLLVVVGFFGAISLMAEAYGVWVVDFDGPGSRDLGGVSGWVASLLGGQLSLAGVAVMFLLAPDGHLLSPRWRVAAVTSLVGLGACVAALVTLSPTAYDIGVETVPSSPITNVLFTGGFLLITAGLVASVVSMVVRMRRSDGVQRQQLRLVAASAALVTIGLINLAVVQGLNGGRQTWAAALPLFVSYSLLPVLFAVAVLRYRLFDLELIINRAVILAVGTAFAGIGYTGIVVAVGEVVDAQTRVFWVSLVSTAVVALAFQPLRRGVVRLANRLAYGPRAVPYVALADFSRSLAQTPSLDSLLPTVAGAAGRAVSAGSAAAVLDVPGAPSLSGAWSGPDVAVGEPYVVPVQQGGEVLGRIEVVPQRGRAVRDADQRLLRGLAEQAAPAFGNAAMTAQLETHVAELDRTTRQLAESRRRLVEADDDARRLLEAAIGREVLPHLTGLASALGRVRVDALAGDASAADRLEGLVEQTNAALDALRELTRGIFPTQLTRMGVASTLAAHLARAGLADRLQVAPSLTGRRLPERVEAALYLGCVEAARSVVAPRRIHLRMEGEDVVAEVVGGALDDVARQAVVDRVEATGGSTSWTDGTLVIRIPCPADETVAG